MKKTLNDIFDEASAVEIENLVNQNKADDVSSDTLSDIKSKVYAKTGITKTQNKKPLFLRWQSYVAAAACVGLLIGGIFGAPLLFDRDAHVDTLSKPDTFSSIREFEAHEREAGTNAVSVYYIPKDLSSEYTLSKITKTDDVYVMFEYTTDASEVTSTSGLSKYDAERLQTLICRCSLYSDGETALKENFADKGYEKIEYDGKTYYRWDEHTENDPEKQIIGYEIAFLQDGRLIFMHLPGLDTFENMMKFAILQKMTVGALQE